MEGLAPLRVVLFEGLALVVTAEPTSLRGVEFVEESCLRLPKDTSAGVVHPVRRDGQLTPAVSLHGRASRAIRYDRLQMWHQQLAVRLDFLKEAVHRGPLADVALYLRTRLTAQERNPPPLLLEM